MDQKERAIFKNGEYNILQPLFLKRYLSYLKDAYTSLVEAEWKWTLQVLAIIFMGSWLIFALIWWLIAYLHNDLVIDHLPNHQGETGWTPCVLEIYGFTSCFLYSVETQVTTGYGSRTITEECPEAIFMLCAQCLIGLIIDSFTMGVVFAKMARPKVKNYTILFSRNAIVCTRDGILCMMFRIGNLRKSRLVEVVVRAIVIQDSSTEEGEMLENYETELKLECDESGSNLFYIWPVAALHKINENSPFYQWSARDMLQNKFEVIVNLDYKIESTGQRTNAKTSYLPNEILWGYRFENIVTFNDKMKCYEANFADFDKILKIEMPLCSAADILESSDSHNKNSKEEPMEDIGWNIENTDEKTGYAKNPQHSNIPHCSTNRQQNCYENENKSHISKLPKLRIIQNLSKDLIFGKKFAHRQSSEV